MGRQIFNAYFYGPNYYYFFFPKNLFFLELLFFGHSFPCTSHLNNPKYSTKSLNLLSVYSDTSSIPKQENGIKVSLQSLLICSTQDWLITLSFLVDIRIELGWTSGFILESLFTGDSHHLSPGKEWMRRRVLGMKVEEEVAWSCRAMWAMVRILASTLNEKRGLQGFEQRGNMIWLTFHLDHSDCCMEGKN